MPEQGFIEGLLAAINAEPVTALMVGLLLGVLFATGRASLLFAAKLLRSMRTGHWDNGSFTLHDVARNQQLMIERQQEIKTLVAKLAEHQAENYKSMRELVAQQATHDSTTALELEKLNGSVKRLVDRL